MRPRSQKQQTYAQFVRTVRKLTAKCVAALDITDEQEQIFRNGVGKIIKEQGRQAAIRHLLRQWDNGWKFIALNDAKPGRIAWDNRDRSYPDELYYYHFIYAVFADKDPLK